MPTSDDTVVGWLQHIGKPRSQVGNSRCDTQDHRRFTTSVSQQHRAAQVHHEISHAFRVGEVIIAAVEEQEGHQLLTGHRLQVTIELQFSFCKNKIISSAVPSVCI